MDHADLALVRTLEEEPGWASLICDAFVKIYRGHWTETYVSLITDRWGHTLTFGDVYAFLQVHAMLCAGDAVMTELEVGEVPHLDKYADQNNSALKELPQPFSGEFWGGPGDSDGYVSWSEPIAANTVIDGAVKSQRTVPIASAPLEVGHTNGVTTLRHLRQERRLARWPYDSTTITVIHSFEPFAWNMYPESYAVRAHSPSPIRCSLQFDLGSS